MTMPVGMYYIGDLCYVMGDEWDEVCDITIQGNQCLSGEFTMSDGRRFALQHTAWGDGEYYDEQGRSYSVDAGLIGCILVRDILPADEDHPCTGGQVVEMAVPFEVTEKDGMISFGNVVHIDTDPSPEDDDENEYDN